MLEDRSSPCSLKGLCSLCLPKSLIDFFFVLFSWVNLFQLPQPHVFLILFSLISLFIFEQPHFVLPKKLLLKVKHFPSTSKSFFLISSSLPIPSYLLPCTSSHSHFFLPQTGTLKLPSPAAIPSPPVDSALPFPLFDFSSFLSANAWQRSPWLYIFIVIKLGQSPFAGTRSKWHSLAHVHTAKPSSSHNRMALSFLPIGNLPWQVLLSEPCPATASQSTP